MKGMQSPTIEVHESSSRKELVDDVLRFAKAQNAGYIAVNTRRLLSSLPFKVGGFAEALIGNSKLPIIAVSPRAKVSNKIKRILFPTDFTRQSHQAFRKTLKLASLFKAQVEILHVELPLFVPFAYSEMAAGLGADYMKVAAKAQRKRVRKNAKHWLEEANKAGVKCVYRTMRGNGSIAPSILRAAQRSRTDLISLAGYRNPKTPAILGGTVRDVLSLARTPVLEIHAP
ncbi:MAG: universal stress protein [Bdellovibrionota bacterium]